MGNSSSTKTINLYSLEKIDGVYCEDQSKIPFSGTGILHHSNGYMRYEFTFKNGYKNGLSMEWFENGQPRCVDYWKDNERHGLGRYFHENGQLSCETNFIDGKEEGHVQYFDSKGRLDWEGTYKNGSCEESIVYYEDGKIKEISTQTGYKSSYNKKFHPNTQNRLLKGFLKLLRNKEESKPELSSVEIYNQGKRDGVWKWFDKEGNLTKTQEWKDGELVESWKQK